LVTIKVLISSFIEGFYKALLIIDIRLLESKVVNKLNREFSLLIVGEINDIS